MTKNYDVLNEILDDSEKLSLQMFVENDKQREAVRKVLLCGLYYNGTLEKKKPANPLVNFALGLVSNRVELKLSDEELGRFLSIQWEAINLLEVAFSNLARFKKENKKVGDEKNEAR